MTQQQKDELNKELCGLLGLCWHHFMEKEYRCTHCDAPDYEKNPDFTSEAGRINLLKIIDSLPNGQIHRLLAKINQLSLDEDGDFIDYAVPVSLLTDDNGAFAIAARDFLKAMEEKS